MVVNRRSVLAGALGASALLVSGCHSGPATSGSGEPVVPWPDGNTILGIGMEGYPYPHQVHYLDVTHLAQADWIERQAPDWERRARLAYMDVAPEGGQPKDTVLLVHGKNFFGAYWSGVTETLRHNGFRVIVPDLIGWGKSTKPSTLTAASLVAELRSLLDALKVNSVVLVGHSTGGLIGMYMTRALPERLHALVLENPMGLEDYRKGLTRPVRHQDWANDERSMTADQVRQYMAHEPAVNFVATLSTSTLFVCGLSDRTYAGAKYTAPQDQAAKGNIAEMAKGFAATMPKARFVGVPDTGHVPHLESPAAFTSALLDFLR